MTQTQDFLSECFAPTNNLKLTYVVFIVKYFYWTGALATGWNGVSRSTRGNQTAVADVSEPASSL